MRILKFWAKSAMALIALATCVPSISATFDIGQGAFPRTFENLAGETASLFDSSGTVITGFVDLGGPVSVRYSAGDFDISARTIFIGAGSSLFVSGTLTILATESMIVNGSIGALDLRISSPFIGPGNISGGGGPLITGGQVTLSIPEPNVSVLMGMGLALLSGLSMSRRRKLEMMAISDRKS